MTVTDESLVTAVTRRFSSAFGAAPAGVWSAPGRVNLIGEHTDYNEGFVLPFAIGARTAVAAARRDDGVLRVSSAQYPDEIVTVPLSGAVPGAVSGWAAYPVGVAWALGVRARGQGNGLPGPDQRSGISLCIESRVPEGAGLSSSAALECAVASALNDLWGTGAGRTELARACQRAENEAVGAPTGIMDQYASLFGEDGGAVFLDCRTVTGESVPLDLAGAGLTILLADTGERHVNSDGGYASRRASCERAARALGVPALRDATLAGLDRAGTALDDETLRRARHIITENERVTETVRALRAGALAGDPGEVGRLLTASHASMRDDFEITTPALDLAAATAIGAGAFGARMTGGGFGGSVLVLVDSRRSETVGDAITGAFAKAGLTVPTLRSVTPSRGARRDAGMS